MLVIKAENVNDAYEDALFRIKMEGVHAESRNGKVIVFPYPVTTQYEYPQERVLFDAKRDANPFFHLFESLWMLGGENEIAFLEQFNSTIGQFSDDGVTLHGAYGHRWINHFQRDQIGFAIQELTENPDSRRCVISMWDPYIDPQVAGAGGKDVPCNTQIYFRVRPQTEKMSSPQLDMTVTCRSNDLVWGCYGANAVHMSMLHEYVSLSVGIEIGTYYQVSNDLHIYERHWDLIQAPGGESNGYFLIGTPQPLMAGGETTDMFDSDVTRFLTNPYEVSAYRTAWFDLTVKPMVLAHAAYKSGRYEASLVLADQIWSEDWRKGCTEWLQRRIAKSQAPVVSSLYTGPWPFPK